MTLSAVLVTENDAPTLDRCPDVLLGAVDEIVVVDTGSTDASRSIAGRFTDKVFEVTADGDLTAARQFAFDRASADWVVWIEPDDALRRAGGIRSLVATAANDVGAFGWRHVLARDEAGRSTNEAWPIRCVRNDGSYRWAGAVLPVLTPTRAWATVASDAVEIERQAPLSAHAQARADRTRQRLDAARAAGRDAAEPSLLFHLAEATAEAGDHGRALDLYREFLTVGASDDERYLAQTRVAAILRAWSDHDAAIDAELRALAIDPHRPDAYFGLAASYYFRMDWPKVVHWIELARQMPVPRTPLAANPLAYEYTWLIHYTNALYRTGDLEGARAFSRFALEQSPHDEWHRANLAYFDRLIDVNTVERDRAAVAAIPHFVVIPVHDRHHYTRTLLRQLGLPPERAIVIDNNSAVPARDALAGLAQIVEYGPRNLSEMWNLGLDLVAAACPGPHNVAVLNNDLEVPPGFLDKLAAGLRARPDILLAYPDDQASLPPGICDPVGRMPGFAFMLRGEVGIRADPQFAWWAGDIDIQAQAGTRGQTVRVGGAHALHLEGDLARRASPELTAISMEDWDRFLAKWGRTPG